MFCQQVDFVVLVNKEFFHFFLQGDVIYFYEVDFIPDLASVRFGLLTVKKKIESSNLAPQKYEMKHC